MALLVKPPTCGQFPLPIEAGTWRVNPLSGRVTHWIYEPWKAWHRIGQEYINPRAPIWLGWIHPDEQYGTEGDKIAINITYRTA